VDLIVEVGGPGTLEQSINVVRHAGIIALIGVVSGAGKINPMPMLSKAARIQALYVGSQEMFTGMSRALSSARVRPVVDRVFPFEHAKEAYTYQARNSQFGKVIISVN
jgi:NADPH:quinone reductase-like Zn-dependent oxidoreductase